MTNREGESERALMLARRTYLYRLFHIVFGSTPTYDSVSKIFDDQTSEMFEAVVERLIRDDFVLLAKQQVGLCGRTVSECADEASLCVREVQGLGAGSALVEEMRSDYVKLFQVPGDAYVHPWESPYTGKETMVFQESTLDVRSFYHDAGFKLRAEKSFPDDHLAAMMDYLGRLSQRAYEAYADGRDNEVLQVLETQLLFVEKHVLTWIDSFATNVIKNDAHAYYGALSGGMVAFVWVDVECTRRFVKELTDRQE